MYVYCGVSLRHRPNGKRLTSERERQRGRGKPRRPRPSLGSVIEGRYIPVHLLHQLEALTPVLAAGLGPTINHGSSALTSSLALMVRGSALGGKTPLIPPHYAVF